MANLNVAPLSTLRARATHSIWPEDISTVLCHRGRENAQEFLLQWQCKDSTSSQSDAIVSWHKLGDLTNALEHVQAYIETVPSLRKSQVIESREAILARVPPRYHDYSASAPLKRKRAASKPYDGDLPTPQDSIHLSRDVSVVSISSSEASISVKHEGESGAASRANIETDEPVVYNGVLRRREGRVTARAAPTHIHATMIDVSLLPTHEMMYAAASIPIAMEVHEMVREAFFAKLKRVPHIRLENDVDTSTPSLDFTFIDQFVLRGKTKRRQPDPTSHEGCQEPCRPNMGEHKGCQQPSMCGCLEFADVDEERLMRKDAKLYAKYLRRREKGQPLDDLRGQLPKWMPYTTNNAGISSLQKFYRESRRPIYECNQNCNCGPVCKSRLVQKGRRVPLTVFKTTNRGWGVKCDEHLIAGEFIDTYLGEVITSKEADKRETAAGMVQKASYLFSLDKFNGDAGGPTDSTNFLIDGQYMGNVTRFINHSCDPNCRMYTVSQNKHDTWIYDLAFFAYDDIPAGTELTFDYNDEDEMEEEDVLRKRAEEAAQMQPGDDRPVCGCGARKCRGYLWKKDVSPE